MLPFRIMYPHIGFLVGLFRLCGACSALRSLALLLCEQCWPPAALGSHAARHAS